MAHEDRQEKAFRAHPNFGSLERQFHALFGADQDFIRFLGDPNYRNSLKPLDQSASAGGFTGDITAGRFSGFMGSLELRELLAAGGGISDIDLGGIFDPLRGNINELSAQSLRNQKANIGRAAEGAQDRAAEGLAGTGLGRSGVAAQQFQGIATRQQELLASAEGQVEEQRLKAMFQIGFKEAQAEHELALGDLNYTRQQIADALGFDRLLFQMQFQAEIDAELAAAQNDGSWFDDLINIGTAALPFIV